MRSIFDLDLEELEQIVKSNTLPPDVELGDIASRRDFDKLFKHRLNPKYIAQIALKERGVAEPVEPKPRVEAKPYQPAESVDMKTQRLQLKQQELQLKAQKQESLTYLQNEILARQNALISGQNSIIESLALMNEKLDRVLNPDSREKTSL